MGEGFTSVQYVVGVFMMLINVRAVGLRRGRKVGRAGIMEGRAGIMETNHG